MRDAAALVERVEPLLPGIAERAAEGERLRRLPRRDPRRAPRGRLVSALVSPSGRGTASGSTPVVALG